MPYTLAAMTTTTIGTGLAAVVAGEIRAEQARQRLSGTQLAKLMGRPNSTVNRWLNGEKELGLDEIGLFARALNANAMEWISKAFSADPRPEPGLAVSSGCSSQGRLIRLIRPARYQFPKVA